MKKLGKIFVLVALTMSVILPGQVLKVQADVVRQNAGLKVNSGYMDNLSISGRELVVRGWHAIDNANSLSRNIHWLFLMDANTDKEIGRWIISNQSIPSFEPRGDVVTHIRNATGVTVNVNCGFIAYLPITANMKGRKVYIMTRYTTDINGNIGVKYADYFYNSTRVYIP